MTLGIVGGIGGVLVGFAVAIAGAEEADLAELLPLGCIAIVMGLAGLAGAGLARGHPLPSLIIMGVAGVVLISVISVSQVVHTGYSHLWLWNASGILLVAGSALGFAARKG